MRVLASMTNDQLNQAYWDAKWVIRDTPLGEDPDMLWVELLVETQMEAMERPGFKFQIARWNAGPMASKTIKERQAMRKGKLVAN